MARHELIESAPIITSGDRSGSYGAWMSCRINLTAGPREAYVVLLRRGGYDEWSLENGLDHRSMWDYWDHRPHDTLTLPDGTEVSASKEAWQAYFFALRSRAKVALDAAASADSGNWVTDAIWPDVRRLRS